MKIARLCTATHCLLSAQIWDPFNVYATTQSLVTHDATGVLPYHCESRLVRTTIHGVGNNYKSGQAHRVINEREFNRTLPLSGVIVVERSEYYMTMMKALSLDEDSSFEWSGRRSRSGKTAPRRKGKVSSVSNYPSTNTWSGFLGIYTMESLIEMHKKERKELQGIYTMESLIEMHKKERKELQAEVQAIKKSVPKGDRKRKKESQETIAKLEAELEERHEQEEQALQVKAQGDEEEISSDMERVIVTDQQQEEGELKMTKAQRRREKKAALEKEREKRIAEEESKNANSSRQIEYNKIKNILKKRNLAIKEISSDGHCLYRAVIDQLKDAETSVESLRKQTAEYMRGHPEDFMAFLTNHETQEPPTTDEFEKYCLDVENTAAWGGQLEINAMSNILEVPVEVIQADGPPIIAGEHLTAPPVILTYHRHAYGLGEHYNSVLPMNSPLRESSGEFS